VENALSLNSFQKLRHLIRIIKTIHKSWGYNHFCCRNYQRSRRNMTKTNNRWIKAINRSRHNPFQCFLYDLFIKLAHDSAGFGWGRAPHQKGPPTMFICLAICACHLILFIEESLFVGVISYRRADGNISLKFHFATKQTLIGFLKVVQVSESSEWKAETRRTH